MATEIQWTDATWNPTTGCTKVSAGCELCYIERTPPFRIRGRKFVNGHIPLEFHESRLDVPLRRRKPTKYFVNSMSDLFHEDVPDAFIDRVFAVMALAPQHTFQILTKRAERMRAYLNEPLYNRLSKIANEMRCDPRFAGARLRQFEAMPLPNVWLGVSVENQRFADQRIPLLLQTPAAVRFISAEPLLGPVDLRVIQDGVIQTDALTGGVTVGRVGLPGNRLDWVIVGGQSGNGAHPFDLAWARSIIAQCQAAGVAAFMKQCGANPFDSERTACQFDSFEQWANKAPSWLGGISGGGVRYKDAEHVVCVDARGRLCSIGRDFMRARDEGAFPVRACQAIDLRDSHGGDIEEFPPCLRVRQFPEAEARRSE